jgi:hypothetical protein
MIYIVGMLGLAVLNYFTSDYPWVLWAAFGWGIGVVAHGLAVYGYSGGERERMVQLELSRLRRGQS